MSTAVPRDPTPVPAWPRSAGRSSLANQARGTGDPGSEALPATRFEGRRAGPESTTRRDTTARSATGPVGDRGPVTIRIDELVLEGFPSLDRYRVADAVTRELERLLLERGVPSGWKDGGAGDEPGTTAPADDRARGKGDRRRTPVEMRLPGEWTEEVLGRMIALHLVRGGGS